MWMLDGLAKRANIKGLFKTDKGYLKGKKVKILYLMKV